MPGPGRDWLRAGRVGRPHGLDGSFHVLDPAPALLAVEGEVLAGAELRRIERLAGTDQRPIVRLSGAGDRSAAEALRGVELYVAREEAQALQDEEWWAEDLEGCRVHDAGAPVGRVRRLLALPSCEVLEVERDDGRDDLLVPLVGDAVRAVDVERREIDVDLAFLGEA